MSGSREKDSSDFDLETFVDLFDTAMTSSNPAVQKAFKNLLMIATLVDSDLTPEQRIKGPLRRLVEDLRDTNRRIDRLQEDQRIYPQKPVVPATPNTTWPGTYPNTNPLTYPNTGPTWPPGTVICKSEDC
jgi:hypothetical protein